MEKVRIGNDMRVNFSVYRNGQPESFDGTSNISTKLVNEAYNKEITHTYTILGNVVQFDIDALQLAQCGKCRLFISYTKGGNYTVDSPAFELVNYTNQTGGTEIIGVEIVSINISGDIGINRDGLSAYEVWEAYPGNEGKTIEEYFLWLRENPTKIDLDGLNSNIDKLHFKADTLVQLTNIGDVRYSQDSRTLEVKVSDTVSIQLGQEMQIRVKNDEAIQINNGQMVYINSAAGANPLAKIASTSNADIAQRTFGMATENIQANGFGAITTEGLVRDINTSAFPEGSMLWLGTNGNVTNIEPVAPVSKISVGMVLRSNANNGVVYVKIRAIARNQKLSDVYAPTLTGGDVLRWNSTTLRFEVFNITSALSNKVDTARTITAGNGLTGGGDLTDDRIINVVNTDDSIVVGEDGIKVDTQDTLTSDSASKPLSAKQGKSLQDNKAEKTRNIVAGDGLSGGGDLTADMTINVVAADDSLIVESDNIKVNTNNTLTSTSTTQPLSANQGKVLNEKVVQVETDLNVINTMYPSFSSAKRIIADSGIIRSKANFNELTGKFVDLLPNTKFLYCPQLAVKLRTTGIYNYITKLYDIGSAMIDGAQTTALNQPYLSGNIAPTEKYALKNPNNGNAYMTHAPILFIATDKWSVSTMLNDFCSALADYGAYCGNGTSASNIYLRKTSANRLRFLSNTSVEYLFNVNNSLIGKNSLITFTAFGDGTLTLYLNGKLFQSITSTDTSFIFSRLLNSYSTFGLNGTVQYHSIRDIALSPTQVQEEYTYLRTLFPEIESVQIGTQTWTTSNYEAICTPQGNIIQEMRAATNVEKIVNGSFDSGSTGWLITGADSTHTVTFTDGKARYQIDTTTPVLNLYQSVVSQGKWYKVVVDIESITSGGVKLLGLIVNGIEPPITSIGITTFYCFSTGSAAGLYRSAGNTDVLINSFSVEEVSWSDSSNLYNSIYAATTGTAEQKEYAAVKASAMWCYYNNDPALGAVYGKLYNWYAVKLLQMDIDYYNVGNPTATWGWRVPTSADFTTLSTYLGGDAVAGGKMKKEGLDYWNTPNTGADNSSGFSAIGSGIRVNTGSFSSITSYCIFSTTSGVSDQFMYYVTKGTSSLILSSASRINGYTLRQIKA